MARKRRRRTPARVFRRLMALILDVILLAGLTLIVAALLGVKPYVVESGSMEPAIQTGSVCLINSHARYEDVRLGEVVCFDSAVGKKVIHRAVNITPQGIETQGDANETSDGITTTPETYAGKVLIAVPKVGYGVYWMQSPRGMVISVAVLLVLFILAWEPADERRRRKRRKSRASGQSGHKRNRERV